MIYLSQHRQTPNPNKITYIYY